MASLRAWIIPIVAIISLISAIAGGVWTQRPIIEYTFSGHPDRIDTELEPIGVWLKIKNTGRSYAKLNLVLTVENVNISLNKIEQSMVYNGTQLKIHYDLPSGMDTYDERYVSIEPINNPENLTINLEIENRADWSVPSGFISKFLEPHGYITHLVYNRTDTTTYELIS